MEAKQAQFPPTPRVLPELNRRLEFCRFAEGPLSQAPWSLPHNKKAHHYSSPTGGGGSRTPGIYGAIVALYH